MKAGGANRIVLVTCGTLTEARKIATHVVGNQLAACVNIVSAPVESVYRWKGKVERAREYLLVIKTTAQCLTQLEREVKRLHAYDVPEFIALPIVAGSREYLQWVTDSTKPSPK
jgi:periplasmic divalent cation tolerance protein